MSDPLALVRDVFDETIEVHQRFAAHGLDQIVRAANGIQRALETGGRVFTFGNGGSAGDAEHLAAELLGRFETERRGLRAMALTADSSTLTAIANDYGYADVFARQIEALASPADVAIGISTSGKSENVLRALTCARSLGVLTIALTGRDGGAVGLSADVHLNVPEQRTARVQEVHRTILHAICTLVDQGRQPNTE